MPRKFYLRKIRINSGGYDRSGKYWGTGQMSLYHYSCDAIGDLLEVSAHLRASGRDAAKAEILERYPDATFFGDTAFKEATVATGADAYGKGVLAGIELCIATCTVRNYMGITNMLRNMAMTEGYMPKDDKFQPVLKDSPND